MNKVLIPMIRKIAPTLIAQDIVGVQPMPSSVYDTFSNIKPKFLTYNVLDESWQKTCPAGNTAIETNVEIAHWIEQQPVHMWKYIDLNARGMEYHLSTHFFVSNELLTWLKLRWGA